MLLHAGVDNAISLLQRIIPAYASGTLDQAHHPHAVGVLFRRLGVCRMLTQGIAEPLFLAQMQSTSAYLHRLPRMSDEDKVTSRAAVFWDAIGGEYWEAASEIAWNSRSTPHRSWEHEDDFLFVWFLMSRYFRDGPPPDDEADQTVYEQRQRELLDRWEVVLEGGYDPRHSLCSALLSGDAGGFRQAFAEVADVREARILRQVQEGKLSREDAAWTLPFWGEGLALLRLAERDGLKVDEHFKMVPEITRGQCPYAYDPRAWGRIDFRPTPRSQAG